MLPGVRLARFCRGVGLRRESIRSTFRKRAGSGVPSRGGAGETMLFVVTAIDRPGALEQRLEIRPRHIEYLKNWVGQIKMGGALLDESDQPMGSLLVIETTGRAEAEAFVADDPFTQEGVYEQVIIRPFRAVLGDWIA
jgi:uncharacterized protein YciI